MTSITKDWQINMAADIGNGFTKVAIDQQRMKLQPSIIAYANQVPHAPTQDDHTVLANLANDLEISVQSPGALAADDTHYLVGKAAYNCTNSISFNIGANADKAHEDLTLIMTLSMITLNILQRYLTRKHLPSQINVTVDYLTTALPIVEAMNEQHLEWLKQRYANNTHMVTVYNFAEPITLRIKFNHVSVISEGVIGNLGLAIDPHNLKPRPASFYKAGLENRNHTKNFNGQTLLQDVENIVGIDIGDGTVDISVVGQGFTPMPRLNVFIDEGIGTLINNILAQLRQQSIRINNRQMFLQMMSQDNARGKFLRTKLSHELIVIERPILERLKSIYTSLNNNVGLIYFHGAGATALHHEDFNNRLHNLIQTMDPWEATNILWLDAQFSQWLNLEGLEVQLRQQINANK